MLVCSGVTAREEGRCFGVGIIKSGRFCARIESEEKAQAMRGVIAGPGGTIPKLPWPAPKMAASTKRQVMREVGWPSRDYVSSSLGILLDCSWLYCDQALGQPFLSWVVAIFCQHRRAFCGGKKGNELFCESRVWCFFQYGCVKDEWFRAHDCFTPLHFER